MIHRTLCKWPLTGRKGLQMGLWTDAWRDSTRPYLRALVGWVAGTCNTTPPQALHAGKAAWSTPASVSA